MKNTSREARCANEGKNSCDENGWDDPPYWRQEPSWCSSWNRGPSWKAHGTDWMDQPRNSTAQWAECAKTGQQNSENTTASWQTRSGSTKSQGWWSQRTSPDEQHASVITGDFWWSENATGLDNTTMMKVTKDEKCKPALRTPPQRSGDGTDSDDAWGGWCQPVASKRRPVPEKHDAQKPKRMSLNSDDEGSQPDSQGRPDPDMKTDLPAALKNEGKSSKRGPNEGQDDSDDDWGGWNGGGSQDGRESKKVAIPENRKMPIKANIRATRRPLPIGRVIKSVAERKEGGNVSVAGRLSVCTKRSVAKKARANKADQDAHNETRRRVALNSDTDDDRLPAHQCDARDTGDDRLPGHERESRDTPPVGISFRGRKRLGMDDDEVQDEAPDTDEPNGSEVANKLNTFVLKARPKCRPSHPKHASSSGPLPEMLGQGSPPKPSADSATPPRASALSLPSPAEPRVRPPDRVVEAYHEGYMSDVEFDNEQIMESQLEAVSPMEVFFSQNSCSRWFRNGRSLDDLITDLATRRIEPLKADSLIIRVSWFWSSITQQRRYVSWDNRRLLCFKKAFQDFDVARQILIRVVPLGKQERNRLSKLLGGTDGETIEVR